MTTDLFEHDLRAALHDLVPARVPGSLSEKVGSLRARDRTHGRWFGRLASAAMGTVVVVLVVVVGAVAVLRTGWEPAAAGAGTEPKAFSWGTQMATLAADRLTVDVGGRAFVGPQHVRYVVSDPGSATYRTLELSWQDHGTEMRLNLYLGADRTSWWIDQIRTYDGRDPGNWIYYLGPSFRTPLGQSFSGNLNLFGVGIGGFGRLQIWGMELGAFEPGTVPPVFDQCRPVAPGGGGPFGPPVAQPMHPDLSEFGIAQGMDGVEVQSRLLAQGICHVFRLELTAINRGQIWCTAPPGKVREFAFGGSGEIIVFIEDPTILPLDHEPPQVVGC